MSFDQSYYEKGGHSGMTSSFWDDPVQQEQLGFKWADLLKMEPYHSLLIVGCAKGYEVRFPVEKGKNAFGVDVSEYAINNCDPSVKVRCDLYDGVTLPDIEDAYDCVASFDVLSLAKEKEKLADEMCRVARKGILLRTSIKPWRLPAGEIHGRDGIPFTLETFDFWDRAFTQSGKFLLKDFRLEVWKPDFYRATYWFGRV